MISKLKHTRLSAQQAQNYSKQKISLDWLAARDLQPAIAMKMHLIRAGGINYRPHKDR